MPDYQPQVTRKDVLRIIKRDYPNKQAQDIISLLSNFDPKQYHCGLHDRIYLAILKMAK